MRATAASAAGWPRVAQRAPGPETALDAFTPGPRSGPRGRLGLGRLSLLAGRGASLRRDGLGFFGRRVGGRIRLRRRLAGRRASLRRLRLGALDRRGSGRIGLHPGGGRWLTGGGTSLRRGRLRPAVSPGRAARGRPGGWSARSALVERRLGCSRTGRRGGFGRTCVGSRGELGAEHRLELGRHFAPRLIRPAGSRPLSLRAASRRRPVVASRITPAATAASVLPFFEKLSPCLVGMEACATSHHWARSIEQLGHHVRLMPPRYVKAYVKN